MTEAWKSIYKAKNGLTQHQTNLQEEFNQNCQEGKKERLRQTHPTETKSIERERTAQEWNLRGKVKSKITRRQTKKRFKSK